jgi:hypothetical protein
MQNLSLMSFLLCTISDINVAGGTNPSDEPDFIPMHVLSELKFFCFGFASPFCHFRLILLFEICLDFVILYLSYQQIDQNDILKRNYLDR